MPTPKSDVINYFHTEFQSPTPLMPDLENQFFLKAIGDYELSLEALNYDSANEIFGDELSIPKQSLIGKLMYKHYLTRERDRILKLNNIVGKDISLTSMGSSKSSILKACESVEYEIEKTISRLKTNSYY